MLLKKHFEVKKHHHHRHESIPGVCISVIEDSEVKYEFLTAIWKYKEMQGVSGEQQTNYELSQEEEDWFKREVNTAAMKVKSKMGNFAIKDIGMVETNELNTDKEAHNFAYRVEPGWQSNAEIITSHIHNYIVNYVLWRWWINSGFTERANTYAAIADDWLREMYSELNSYDIEREFLYRYAFRTRND